MRMVEDNKITANISQSFLSRSVSRRLSGSRLSPVPAKQEAPPSIAAIFPPSTSSGSIAIGGERSDVLAAEEAVWPDEVEGGGG